MSNKDNHRARIDKYLKGKLDARAMHQLEREAQDDPFLMDALEGYEANGKDQQLNLNELQQRLAERLAPKKERSILLWRVLPIAAALLLMIGIGYWELAPKLEANKQIAALIKPQPSAKQIVQSEPKKNVPIPKNISATRSIPPVIRTKIPPAQPKAEAMIAAVPDDRKVTYATDTVEYKASAYKVKSNSNVDELLKHMQGMEVGADGTLTHQGQAVSKVRINGKDFMGGNVAQATKNLPADVIEKIQVIDDYGDQAGKTGVKSGDPVKVLNITTNGPRMVTGKVVAKDDGQPLPGAVVMVNGKDKVVTNAKGEFKITLPANNDLLSANYVGYVSQQVNVGNSDSVKIELSPGSNSLAEVAIVGYGTQKKREITGSPQLRSVSIRGDTTRLAQAIAGQAAGVAIIKANAPADKAKPYEAEHPADGWETYNKYLDQNTALPVGAKRITIKLEFTVNPNGTINNIKVLKGSIDELNQRAIKLIENGPAWKGANDGNPKQVKLNVKFHK